MPRRSRKPRPPSPTQKALASGLEVLRAEFQALLERVEKLEGTDEAVVVEGFRVEMDDEDADVMPPEVRR